MQCQTDCNDDYCVWCLPDRELASWTKIDGMPTRLDQLLQEEWSILAWMGRHATTADQDEYEAIVDHLIRIGREIDTFDNPVEEF